MSVGSELEKRLRKAEQERDEVVAFFAQCLQKSLADDELEEAIARRVQNATQAQRAACAQAAGKAMGPHGRVRVEVLDAILATELVQG